MIIRFSRKLYNLKAVRDGISAYGDIADFVLSKNERFFIVEIKSSEDKEDFICEEFCNYVLSKVK